MNFDYSKIKGKIRELGLTQSEYAKYIGITEQTLILRFKNKRPFTQPEMAMTMHLFNEPIENVRIYFFTQKIKKNLTNI